MAPTGSVNWLNTAAIAMLRKDTYRQDDQGCLVSKPQTANSWCVLMPQRAITPGQHVTFYERSAIGWSDHTNPGTPVNDQKCELYMTDADPFSPLAPPTDATDQVRDLALS